MVYDIRGLCSQLLYSEASVASNSILEVSVESYSTLEVSEDNYFSEDVSDVSNSSAGLLEPATLF